MISVRCEPSSLSDTRTFFLDCKKNDKTSIPSAFLTTWEQVQSVLAMDDKQLKANLAKATNVNANGMNASDDVNTEASILLDSTQVDSIPTDQLDASYRHSCSKINSYRI